MAVSEAKIKLAGSSKIQVQNAKAEIKRAMLEASYQQFEY